MVSKVRSPALRLQIVLRAVGVCLAATLPLSDSVFAQTAAGAQNAASAQLQVSGDVKTPLTLSLTEIKAMRHIRVDVQTEDGRTVMYDGVPVTELLTRAGATLGNALRGAALTTYVVASASDGYQVVFSLAELDDGLTAIQIIIADAAGGQPLAATQGPLRLVAPKDSKPARSVRMLQRLEVVRIKK